MARLPRPEAAMLTLHAAGIGQSPIAYLSLRAYDAVHPESGRSGRYDVVDRKMLDASVIVPYTIRDDVPLVRLRSAFRPPLATRRHAELAAPAVIWELPAGLIDAGETAEESARRELFEELGVHAISIEALGGPLVPAPGLIAELQYFFAAEIADAGPGADLTPPDEGDGSVFEQGASVCEVSLHEALAACSEGEIWDAKTELGLRRFADWLARRP